MTTLIIIFSFCVIVCFWALWCNEIAYNQRFNLLNSSSELLKEYKNNLHNVTHHEHWKYLLTLRNPYNLYKDNK